MPAVARVGRQACVSVRRYSSNGPKSTRWRRRAADGTVKYPPPKDRSKEPQGPSLFEQLFPEQRAKERTSPASEPPPLPPVTLDASPPRNTHSKLFTSKEREAAREVHWSQRQKRLRNEMASQPTQTSVLVLRSASKNLVEEDFRRLIPKGKHMESWTMEQGDILSIVPMRDLATLAHKGVYYLLFSSALSAFTYQGYASRIYRMVAAHTPSSILSPIPPPPGFLIDGMDAQATMESFSLVPPTQTLELRQLKPPLAPTVQEIVRHGGYAALRNREDRMPFEARLTMDGPQLRMRSLRHILAESAKSRALGWSGGDNLVPQLSKWIPPRDVAEGNAQTAANETEADGESIAPKDGQPRRRTPSSVYILGFHTQRALQSFIAYWHRRPLTGSLASESEDYESPAIANVEVLW